MNKAEQTARSGEGKQAATRLKERVEKFTAAEQVILAARTQERTDALAFLSKVVFGTAGITTLLGIIIGAKISAAIGQKMNQQATAIAKSAMEIAATIEQQERSAVFQSAATTETTAHLDRLSCASQQAAEETTHSSTCAAAKPWIDEHPSTFRTLNKAIIDGCNYARNPGNRREIARAIAAPEYLNQRQSVLEAVLTGTFEDGLGNVQTINNRLDFDPYPWKSFSYWITAQFARWGMVEGQDISHEAIADEVFLTGLAQQLAKQLGQTPPTIILRDEQLKFGIFDPSEPDAYLQAQIQKPGF